MQKEVKAALITGGASVVAAIVTAFLTASPIAHSAARSGIADEIESDRTKQTIRQIVQLEVDKLAVLSAGIVDASGSVEAWKGINVSAFANNNDGTTKVNFGVPFKDVNPIVLATPLESETIVDIAKVDTTGFIVQGRDVGSQPTRRRTVKFSLSL